MGEEQKSLPKNKGYTIGEWLKQNPGKSISDYFLSHDANNSWDSVSTYLLNFSDNNNKKEPIKEPHVESRGKSSKRKFKDTNKAKTLHLNEFESKLKSFFQFNNHHISNYIITKNRSRYTYGVFFDKEHSRVFIVNKSGIEPSMRIFNFSDLLSCEIVDDKKSSYTKEGTGCFGGFFSFAFLAYLYMRFIGHDFGYNISMFDAVLYSGIVGAILGIFGRKSYKEEKTVKSLKVKLLLSDINNPLVEIHFIKEGDLFGNFFYEEKKEIAETLHNYFTVIIKSSKNQ